MLFGGLLSHQSKLQSTVVLSLTKTEYMAITETRKEVLWVAGFLVCLGFAYLVNLSTYVQITKGLFH